MEVFHSVKEGTFVAFVFPGRGAGIALLLENICHRDSVTQSLQQSVAVAGGPETPQPLERPQPSPFKNSLLIPPPNSCLHTNLVISVVVIPPNPALHAAADLMCFIKHEWWLILVETSAEAAVCLWMCASHCRATFITLIITIFPQSGSVAPVSPSPSSPLSFLPREQ